METKLIYSAFSGTYYYIPESDLKLMDMGQLPLLKKPSNSCKSCFGRGHIGRDSQNLTYEVCNCVRKCLDVEYIKQSIKDKIDLKNINLQ